MVCKWCGKEFDVDEVRDEVDEYIQDADGVNYSDVEDNTYDGDYFGLCAWCAEHEIDLMAGPDESYAAYP